ncbi:MAG: hypothetical protein PHY90_12380 [Desulfitobacteriaceae bacterium]|nr:hypothetical protein [Desulfitobacteriaceae bacterium]
MIDKQQRLAELASENYDTTFYQHENSTSYIGMIDSWARNFMYYASRCFGDYCNRINNDLVEYKKTLEADKLFLESEICHCNKQKAYYEKKIAEAKEKSSQLQKCYRVFSIRSELVLASHEFKIIENKINNGCHTAGDIKRRFEIENLVREYELAIAEQKRLYREYKAADVEHRTAVDDFKKSNYHRSDIAKLERRLVNVNNALAYDCSIVINDLSGLCDDFCKKMNSQFAVGQLASYVTANINHATNRRLNTTDYVDSEKEQVVLNFSQLMEGYSLASFCFLKQTMIPINSVPKKKYDRLDFSFDKFMTNFLFNISLQIRGCVWQSLKNVFFNRNKTQLVIDGKEEFDIVPSDICSSSGGYKTANYRLLNEDCFDQFVDMRKEFMEKKDDIVNSMYVFFACSDKVKKNSIFLQDSEYTKSLFGNAFTEVLNRVGGEIHDNAFIGSKLRSMIVDGFGGLSGNRGDMKVIMNVFRDVIRLYAIDYVWGLNPSKDIYSELKRGVFEKMKKENKIKWSDLEFKIPSQMAKELLRDRVLETEKDDEEKDAGSAVVNQRVDFLLDNKHNPDSSSGKYNQNVWTKRNF